MSRTYLVADLFCGAGGTSTGAARAIRQLGGEMELCAVNHWDKAIATHQRNHPRARHYCVSLETARPSALVPEGRLDLLMASPECVHHSRARGGKPVNDQRRADAWLVNRWLTDLDVDRLLIENVPEFVDWGPICALPVGHRGNHVAGGREPPLTACKRPIPGKRGLYFQAWVKSLWEMEYRVEWRFLNAADFGDATTRKRLFLQARKDGRAIRWPDPTHARVPSADMFHRLERWRPAREVIDWSRPGASLLTRSRPLSVKTRLRIARGLLRFGGPLGPYYVNLLNLPFAELSALAHSPDGAAAAPFLMGQQNSTDSKGDWVPARPWSVDEEPVPTVTTCANIRLIEPVAEAVGAFTFANRTNNVAHGVDHPLPTATTSHGGGVKLVEPVVIGQHGGGVKLVEPVVIGQHGGGEARPMTEPLPTITTDGVIRLVSPHLSPYYGKTEPDSVEEPLSTLTGKQRHGLVDPIVVTYGPRREASSVDDPLPTVMTKDRVAVATPTAEAVAPPEAFVVSRNGHSDPSGRVRVVDEPLYTVTGARTGPPTLVTPFLTPNFGERPTQAPRVHPVDEPVPAVTGRGAGNLIAPDVVPVEASPQGTDRRQLVVIDGTVCRLDIRYRMLTNPELARAMSFDDEGKYDFVGKKSEVTQQIGNAVACRTATALVLAILGEDR